MKIVCGSCGAKYSIADEKVQGKIFKIRCKKCDDVIVVKGTSEGEDLQAAESDFGASYGPSDGASEWYVVLEGEQVGPITAEEVEAYFSVGQLSNDSFVWRDGLENWVPINSVSEFAHLVHLGNSDENTMIAAAPSELGGYVPPDDATAVIDSAKFNAGLYGIGGENPSYSAPDAGGQDYSSQGYGGYEGDGYSQPGAASQPEIGGYGGYQGDAAASPSYNDGYQQQSGGYDDGYDADGGGGMFAAFDSAPAEESDYGGGFGGGYGGGYGGSQEYEANDSGGLSGNAAVSGNDMVGARNENSVLFSLSSLDQVQAVNKPAGGAQAAAAGGNDKSGLIDIQALASAHASMKGGGAAGGGAGGFAGGNDSFAPSTMSMPALMPMPMGSHRNNKGLMMAVIIGGSLVFVGLIAVVVVLLTREQPAPMVITEPAVAEAASAAPAANPEQDAKVAAEAAEAARAALAVAEAPAAPAVEEPAEEAKADEDTRQRSGSTSKPAAKVEKTTAVAAVTAPSKPATKTTTKTASKGGIDDILGQIDSKGSTGGSKTSGSSTASAAPAGDLPPKLTRAHVQTTVRQYNAQILRCQQSSNSNKLSGTVTVRFTVQPSGSVSAANVQAGEFRGTDVGGCIEDAVKGMKFPATQSDLTINYPFIIR